VHCIKVWWVDRGDLEVEVGDLPRQSQGVIVLFT
jgi:hypothetical protein